MYELSYIRMQATFTGHGFFLQTDNYVGYNMDLAVNAYAVVVVLPFCGPELYSNVQTQSWNQSTLLQTKTHFMLSDTAPLKYLRSYTHCSVCFYGATYRMLTFLV